MKTWTVVELIRDFEGRSTDFVTEREAETHARAARKWAGKVYIIMRTSVQSDRLVLEGR